MALSIKHPEADSLARRLSAATGESLTDVVLNALRERLQRQEGRVRAPLLVDELRAIRVRCSNLSVLDSRSPEELIDYDEDGLPR